MEKNDILPLKENEQNSLKEKSSIEITEQNLNNNINNALNENNNNNNIISDNRIISQTLELQNQKFVKFDIENIPLKNTYNLRYCSIDTYKNSNDNIEDIIFAQKYSGDNRSKSAYSKKSFREKFESMKLKVPVIKKWNCDPTAEVIINNLEKKIDILTYENFLLTKKIKKLINNNKELQLSLSQNILLTKTEELINYENSYIKAIPRKNNLKNKKKINKNIEKEKDVDSYEEINKLKDENDKLKKSNENLAENNMKLNKIIIDLRKEIQSNKDKFKEELENNKNIFEQKCSEKNNELNEINNTNENNNFYNGEKNRNQNNSSFDMNKYLMDEEQCKQLIMENEQLHKKLRTLLSIDDNDIIKVSNSFPDYNSNNNRHLLYTPINENNIQFNPINNSDINNNLKNKNQSEDLIIENNLLKQKIKTLNMELNKLNFEHNQKLLKIQEKLSEKEKNLENKIQEDIVEMHNQSNKEEELDKLLNEILMWNVNDEDEENKKMIDTLEKIKNNDKRRISQCMIINNKIKSLYEENNLLHNQLLSLQKEANESKSLNDNLNKIDNKNAQICFCRKGNNESFDYLINALKIKDNIIIKYKEKNDENEYKYKQLIIENSKLKENNKDDSAFIKKDIERNPKKRERAVGLEDYLLDKIVTNQRRVLGERAPNFYENKIMSRSMQYQEENNDYIMYNRYNNYHYRKTKRDNYE